MFGRGRGRRVMRRGGRAPRRPTQPSSATTTSGDADKVSQQDLLDLNLDQLLHPEFVLKQTRGANLDRIELSGDLQPPDEDQDAEDDEEEKKATVEDEDVDGDVSGRSRLVQLVLEESRVEHLTAGFMSSSRTHEKAGTEVLARLSRELAAQALSSDSYQNLANRRSLLLQGLYEAFSDQYRKLKAEKPKKKTLQKSDNLLVDGAVKSGVYVVLSLLKDAARNNRALCVNILDYLAELVENIPALGFSTANAPIIGELNAGSLEIIHHALFEIASDKNTSPDIQSRCSEIILGLAVACGSLSLFLTSLRLHMFPLSPSTQVPVLPLLHKLLNMKRDVFLEPPSATNHETKMSVTDLSAAQMISCATDGKFLYLHCRAGLYKVGTGRGGSTPGLVYAAIKKYRGYEQSSLACVGDKLYYRSPNIAPAGLLVIDTEHLTPDGEIKGDGSGSIASADNTHFGFDVPLAESQKRRRKAKAKADATAASDSKLPLTDAEIEFAKKKAASEMADAKTPGGSDAKSEKSKKEKEDPFAKKQAEDTGADAMDDDEKKGGDAPDAPPGPAGPTEVAAPVDLPDPNEAPAPDAPMGAPDAQAGGAARAATSSSNKKDNKKNSKSKRYHPILSDGRFLYLVTPKKASVEESSNMAKNETFMEVHAMDPEDKYTRAHSIVLRNPDPKPNTVLRFQRNKALGTTMDDFDDYNDTTNSNFSYVNLGCPRHLNFEGSITLETWFRFPADAWAMSTYQGLFYHGDSAYRLYVFMQQTYIYAGCNTRMGGGQVNATISIDTTEWNHLAVVYDSSKSKWILYMNGQEVQSQTSSVGAGSSSADWIIGSSRQYRFGGEMAEVRIWKRPLADFEIQENMKGRPAPDADGLVGYWPLNEGGGLTARDLSSFNHTGSINNCQWIEDIRPVKLSQEDKEAESTPFKFHRRAVGEAVMYTDGESLALLYSEKLASTIYRGINNAVFQVFSLSTGKQLQESEHNYARSALAAAVSPDTDQLFLFQDDQGTGMIHRYRITPPVTLSPWRKERMQGDDVAEDGFPTTKMLEEAFPVPKLEEDDDEEDNEEDSEKKKTDPPSTADSSGIEITFLDLTGDAVSDKDEHDDDWFMVQAEAAICCILARLDDDCKHVKQVTKNKVPAALQHLLAVDLTPTTFVNLLELVEKLAEEYYSMGAAPVDKKERSKQELRAFAFLVCLRLLRINVMHLVEWNVDPAQCGFDQSSLVVAKHSRRKRRHRHRLHHKQELAPVRLRERFVTLLNKLIVDQPKGEIPKIVSQRVCSAVCDILSMGMSVFYGPPVERVRILSDLVTEALSPKDQKPLRVLLMNRYFASQSKATNVVSMVPAIVELSRAITDDSSPADKQMAHLLETMVVLLADHTKRLLTSRLKSSTTGKHETDDSLDWGIALREFLGRAQIVILTRARESVSDYAFCFKYARRIIDICHELIEFCLEKVEKLGRGGNKRIIGLSTISDVLETSVRSLLLPLFSGLWKIIPDTKTASGLLPRIFRLLRSLDKLSSQMPDVTATERSFLQGQTKKVLISRTSVVESIHPAKQGITEKTLTIAGVKELLLDFDPKTFQNLASGAMVTLYRKPGQLDPIDGGSFTSMPRKPIKVSGDTVTIVFNGGYNSNWGFKVTGKGFVEEESIDLPWLLDLTKNVALFSGKCAGVIMRGGGLHKHEMDCQKWIESELLSEGVEHNDQLEMQETMETPWLPTDLADEATQADLPPDLLSRPFLARQRSYFNVSLVELAKEFCAKMKAKRVMVAPFPVPADVKSLVEDTITLVMAVLIKHNKVTTDVRQFVDGNDPPPAHLVRVFKTPHKLRQWMLQAYQTKRSDSDGNDAQEEVKMEDLSKNKVKIYTKICESVKERALFLINVVPVPSPAESLSVTPKLARQRSNEPSEPAMAMTEDEKKAQATMMAWQSTRDTVSLRYASPEERFTLLWKHVLNFLDDHELSLDSLVAAMKCRRTRARLRTCGFKIIVQLLEAVSLSSVKRELVSAIMPALSWSFKDFLAGVPPELMFRLRPCGEKLTKDVRASAEELYSRLIQLLNKPQHSGSQLLQAALHSLGITYDDEDFRMVLRLGIFPALHTILQTDVAVTTDKAGKETAHIERKQKEVKEQEPDMATSGQQKKEELTQVPFKTSAWALLDLLTTVLSEQQQRQLKSQLALNADAPPKPTKDERKEPVYHILLSQLDKIASTLKEERATAGKPAGFVPSLPDSGTLQLGGSGPSRFDQAVSQKVRTAMAFGMATSGAEMDESGAIVEQSSGSFSDSFSIRVLNLVEHVCVMAEGATHVSTPKGLAALFTILCLGSSRTRTVCLRILRKLLALSPSLSPSPTAIDAALSPLVKLSGADKTEAASSGDSPQKSNKKKKKKKGKSSKGAEPVLDMPSLDASSVAGKLTVEFLLRDVGQRLSAPCFTALSINSKAIGVEEVRDKLHELGLYSLYSSDGVCSWAEEAMLLRFLTSSATHNDHWRSLIASTVQSSIKTLPSLVKRLSQSMEKKDAAEDDRVLAVDRALWADLWLCLGSLAVYGGYFDTQRVGARVYIKSLDDTGVIVSRDYKKSTLSILRDGEGSISEENVADVVLLGDIAFDKDTFVGVDSSSMVEVLASVVAGLSGNEKLGIKMQTLEAEQKRKEAKKHDEDSEVGAPVQISLASMALCILHSRSLRAVHSLLLDDKGVATLLEQKKFSALYTLGRFLSPMVDTNQVPTSLMEEKSASLRSELARRALPPAPIQVTVQADQPRVKLHKPQLEVEAEYCAVGGSVGRGLSINSTLSYIRLNEEPTEKNCSGKVVLLDTYGDLEKRLEKASDCNAQAIILALHSATAKMEGLHDQDDDEDDKKEEKTDVLAQAHEAVMAAAVAGNEEDAYNDMGGFGGGLNRGGVPVTTTTAQEETKTKKVIRSALKGDERLIPNTPVVCVSNSISNALRALLGLRDEDNPERLNREMLSAELVKRGYPEKHCVRALEKNDFDVDAAAKWMDANSEWLYDDESAMVEDIVQPTERKDRISAEEEASELESAWSQFNKDTPDSDTLETMALLSAKRELFPAGWHLELPSRSTHSLLAEFMRSEWFLIIQYARRAVGSVLLRFPSSHDWSVLGSQDVLQHALRMAMTLSVYPACERNARSFIRVVSYQSLLLKAMRAWNKPKQCLPATVALVEDAERILKVATEELPPDADSDSLVHSHTIEISANVATNQAGQELTIPGFSAMRLSFQPDAQSLRNCYMLHVYLYSDAACTDLIRHVTVSRYNRGEEVVVPSNTVYYTQCSPSWYQGSVNMFVTVSARNVSLQLVPPDAAILGGSVHSALNAIDLAMRAGGQIPSQVLLYLLWSLGRVTDTFVAQDSCRMAIRLFNNLELLTGNDDVKLRAQIVQWVNSLAKAHAGLRTSVLVNWNAGAVPGPHVQNLLELVLAGRKALGMDEDDEKKQQEKVADADADADKKSAPQYVLDNFKHNRDGQIDVSMIYVTERRVISTAVIASRDNSHIQDLYVGDVSVRGGGKWYYEVRLKAVPQQMSIGWIRRGFRLNNMCYSVGMDRSGDSWAVHGANTRYYHRGSQRQPSQAGGKEDELVIASWHAGLVIGCMIDLENREMQFTFDGKSTGIAFSNIDVGEGVYPAVSVGRNAQCSVNFGKEPFVYLPPVSDEISAINEKRQQKVSAGKDVDDEHTIDETGWCSLHDPRVSSSSWLARYRHASDVTHMLYERTPIPAEVVASALEAEVSLSPTDMNFELFDTDCQDVSGGMWGPENVLSSDTKYFQASKARNVHMTFNAVGKEADIILQEVSVACNSSTPGFQGMVFVSQKEPDLDSFSWCDNFTESHYKRFVDKKKTTRQAYRSHEPIAYIQSTTPFARVKLDVPRRGRYITLKLSSKSGRNMLIEHVDFTCMHGAHPLGRLIGTPLLESKQAELKKELADASVRASNDKGWTLKMDAELISMVQTLCGKLGVSPKSLDSIMFSPGPDELMRFKVLENQPLNLLRARFALLKYLNRLVTPLLHYVDIRLVNRLSKLEESEDDTIGDAMGKAVGIAVTESKADMDRFDDKSLSYIVHQLKGLYFMSTKKSVFEALLSMGGTEQKSRPNIRVTINRIKAMRAKENPAKDPDGLNSVFGQMFMSLRTHKYEVFRGGKNQQMFSVTFLGEGSIDVGGPYRESITNMCADLMSENTPLFLPCPNRKNSVGLNREKFIINPGARSSLHMAMFEFVGVLMGIALCTGETLNLDLPSILWKQLLGEEVEVSDLEAVDKLCIQALGELNKLNKMKFEYLVTDEKFTTQLSDGSVYELKKDGKNTPVTYENRDEFMDLSIQARLHESDQQIKAIKKGLNQVVPMNMLTLFSWFDLELLVCGNPVIDLKVLRKHTQVRGASANSSLIKNMWKVLESFNMEERQMFLRFVWGRSRLPVSESDWSRDFTVNVIRAKDDKLPIAHTCFFSLELPMYSNYEIMRKKLLFAVFNCQAIDVDFNPDSSSLNAWVT